MLKVVVFDGGYGGEMFADLLEEEMPVVEVVRVIDWQNARALRRGIRSARLRAEAALAEHIGKADLIVFANHLLSISSLEYFRRRYPGQKFLGLKLELPNGETARSCLVLTTRAVARTLGFRYYVRQIQTGAKTLRLDAWAELIDQGELGETEIAATFEAAAIRREQPRNIVLACATFRDVKAELNGYFNQNVRVYDGFETAVRTACKMLKIRGGVGRK